MYDPGIKYRSRGVLSYDWTGADTTLNRFVSPTRRYVKSGSNYTFESSRLASNSGFVVRPLRNDGRSAIAQINHALGNPYCSSLNNIDYDIRQELQQPGGHYFYGRHDRMPNHSLYKKLDKSDGTSSISLIFNHQYTSPVCLNPVANCQQWEYEYTG